MSAYNHKPEATLYVCEHCTARFPDRVGINRHLKLQHGLGPKALGTLSTVDWYCNSKVYSGGKSFPVISQEIHACSFR